MCGRYAQSALPKVIKEAFGLDRVPEFPERYNIAPPQIAPIIRMDDAGRLQCEMMRWGLIPHWAKDEKIGNHTINARIETASSKPAFRDAWKRRRCIVPATGFYEWKVQDGKQPFFIHRKDGQPYGFAGLWEYWKSPEGELHTYTIMTTDADDFMKPIHNRMPVMVSAGRIDGWLLHTQGSEVSYDLDDMEMYPVSTYVNSPRNEGPGCVAIEAPQR